MIPGINGFLTEDFEIEIQPSKAHKMNLENQVINGYVDGLEEMKQTIYMILNTERYQYIIYSWNYGIELIDLFGEPVTYVCPELERRITEALTQDERILSVDAFSFDTSVKRKVQVTFTAHTIFGDIDAEKVVNV
jgi:phage baseplate assembly protein W